MAIESPILAIGSVIIMSTLIALALSILKQPSIIAYVLTGLIVLLTGVTSNMEMVSRLSELGIAFLLFLVGLEMDIRKLKSISMTAAFVGLGQVIITGVGATVILIALKFPLNQAAFLGLALAFSSTMVGVKLMSDKGELDTLHGRLIVGILLLQDVIAIIALTLVSGNFSAETMGISLLKGAALFTVAIVCGKIFLPLLYSRIAKSQELLFMTSISWCFAMAIAASMLGYSLAIGAFLAGISLATLKYGLEISSRVKSLRDFFATIFFVSLGMKLTITSSAQLINGIILSVLVIIIMPLSVILMMSLLGYNKKVSFLTAAGLANLSEFSLILVALAAESGMLGNTGHEIIATFSIVALITIAVASYLINYNMKLYELISPILEPLTKIQLRKIQTEHLPQEFNPAIILCGQNRIGDSIYRKLNQTGKKFLVVDYDPDVIRRLANEKIPCIYGDISDAEISDKMNLEKVELVISTIPEFKANSLLMRRIKEKNRHAIVIVTSDQIEEALELYQQGADYVIMPHFLGGDHASNLIDRFKDLSSILSTRLDHIKELHKRKQHEHAKAKL